MRVGWPSRIKFSQPVAVIATAACLLLASGAPPAMAQVARTTAIFPLHLDDTSLEGETQGLRADQTARLGRLQAQLRDLLAKSGSYAPLDLATVAKAAGTLNVEHCDGCETGIAQQLDAQVSVTGWVQKVSNLILNINVVIRDVASGKVLRAGSVDIRGNTDESWSRGMAYLVKNRLLAAATPG